MRFINLNNLLLVLIIFEFLPNPDCSTMEEEKKKIFKLLQNLVLSSKGGVQLERLNRKSGSAYVGCFEGPWLSFL